MKNPRQAARRWRRRRGTTTAFQVRERGDLVDITSNAFLATISWFRPGIPTHLSSDSFSLRFAEL